MAAVRNASRDLGPGEALPGGISMRSGIATICPKTSRLRRRLPAMVLGMRWSETAAFFTGRSRRWRIDTAAMGVSPKIRQLKPCGERSPGRSAAPW